MLKEEFEKLTGRTVTTEQFKAFNELYMASNLDKFDFVKSIKKMLLTIPEEQTAHKILVGVAEMPNGTYMTYEAEILNANVETGKIEVKRLSNNRCWAEINFDIWHTKVTEIA